MHKKKIKGHKCGIEYDITEKDKRIVVTYNKCYSELQSYDDKPSIEYDGIKMWCHKSKPHRINGPAITSPDKIDMYFLFGVKMTKEEHTDIITSGINEIDLELSTLQKEVEAIKIKLNK